jgi:hypothetical protein
VGPIVYDQLRDSGQFSRFRGRSCQDASGRISWSSTGLTTVQLICPSTHQPVGPAVPIYVFCGMPLVPSRVGVVFFHQLQGCRVFGDLDQRSWCINCP